MSPPAYQRAEASLRPIASNTSHVAPLVRGADGAARHPYLFPPVSPLRLGHSEEGALIGFSRGKDGRRNKCHFAAADLRAGDAWGREPDSAIEVGIDQFHVESSVGKGPTEPPGRVRRGQNDAG